jgi:cytochrome c biogenesis protein
MAEVTARERVSQRSPLEWAVDRVWRFFCSVRAAVWEIAILAVMVLIGTLRGSSVPNTIAETLPLTRPVVDRWYAWDVFHSLPFALMLALLSVAIAICTINRAPAIWRTIAHPTVKTTQGFLNSAEHAATLTKEAPVPEFEHTIRSTLKQRRYRVLTEEHSGDIHLYADRYRYAKLGTFPFHLALILVLVGGIVGARYGFRNNEFVIPEGSTREVGHGTGLSVKLERFVDSWREDGTPQDYRSDLVLYKHGKEVKRQSIRVNHPMTYGSVVFYQASFGQAIALRVSDAQGRVVYDDAIPVGLYTSRTNPNAPAGRQPLPQVSAQINVIAPSPPGFTDPEAGTIDLQSGEIFVQVRPLGPGADPSQMPPSAVLRQGDIVELGGLTVQFVRERRFTLLQVASNPGIPIFWTAAVLLVGGLAVTFYFPHRRVRAIIRPLPGGAATVTLVPLAKRDWSGQRDFFRIVQDLEARLGVRATVRGQDDQLAEVAAPA